MPMGEMPKGALVVWPKTDDPSDRFETSRRMRGRSVSASKAARLAWAPRSSPAAPSI